MTRRQPVAAGLAIVGVLTAAALAADAMARRANRRLLPELGLIQTVYGTRGFRSAVYARQTTALDLALLDERSDLPRRDMSIRWEGVWRVPDGGPVRLYAGADDEVRIWIDDRLVVDRDLQLGFRTHVDPLELGAGPHRIRIEYVQGRGGHDLNLQWAPDGRAFRPFAPTSLFPREPGDRLLALVSRSAWAGATVRALSLGAVGAAAWLLLPFSALPGLAARWRAGVSRARAAVSRLAARPRVQTGCGIGLAVALLGWAVAHRLGALNPVTFWADDIWVVALASRASLIEALTTPAPVPPGFVLMQWLARRLSTDPGVSLQWLPLAFGLAAPLVLGVLIRQVTGSAALGLAGVALGLLDPFIAQQSVLSKQYSLDALVAVCLLAIAVRSAAGPPVPLARVGLAGALACLFSFPSVFVSVPVFHVLAWHAFRMSTSRQARGRTVAVATSFNVAMAAIYALVLHPRVSPTMVRGWWRDFAPIDDLEGSVQFVVGRWDELLAQMVPGSLPLLAPLAGVGLIWLLAHRLWRPVGLSLVLGTAVLLGTNLLGWYPIGAGYFGRSVLFVHGPVLTLIVVGVHTLTSALRRGRRVANVAALLLLVAYGSQVVVQTEYFDHNHSRFAEELTARVGPDDAVVVSSMGSYLLYVYGRWPADIVRDDTPTRFHLAFRRPLTWIVPVGRGVRRVPIDRGDLDRLRGLVAAARPERVFYFSTRRDVALVGGAIEDQGYRRVETRSSTTATFLIEYRRMASREASAAGVGR